MSVLVYNGVPLRMLDIHGVSMEAVNDGPNFLWNHWRIEARFICNPSATSIADLAGTPTEVGGILPTDTHLILQKALMEPRKKLEFWVGGVRLLESPVSDLDRDCTHGPTPIYCKVTRLKGTRTFEVEYIIETDQHPTARSYDPGTNTNVPTVLSNVWSMREEIDDRWRSVRVVEGQAQFRQDFLFQAAHPNQEFPDEYRQCLLLPCPPNFRRTGLKVAVSPDNRTLSYQIIDTEDFLFPGDGKVAKFEVQQVSGIGRLSQEEVSLQVISLGLGFAQSALNRRFEGPRSFIRSGIGGLLGAYLSTMPSLDIGYQVTSWGTKQASVSDLATFNYQVIGKLLTTRLVNQFKWWGTEYEVSLNYTDLACASHLRLRIPPGTTSDHFIINSIDDLSGTWHNQLNQPGVFTRTRPDGMSLPNEKGARGYDFVDTLYAPLFNADITTETRNVRDNPPAPANKVIRILPN